MTKLILAVLAALTIALGCDASTVDATGRTNSTIPEESIQHNAV